MKISQQCNPLLNNYCTLVQGTFQKRGWEIFRGRGSRSSLWLCVCVSYECQNYIHEVTCVLKDICFLILRDPLLGRWHKTKWGMLWSTQGEGLMMRKRKGNLKTLGKSFWKSGQNNRRIFLVLLYELPYKNVWGISSSGQHPYSALPSFIDSDSYLSLSTVFKTIETAI